MLVLLGFAMIAVFMVLIMTKKLTPVLALIIVPTVFGLFAGAGLGIGDMVLDSMKSMTSTAALLMFAIIYFGLMIDVGLFDPLVKFILRKLGNDPAKVVLGTAILAAAVSLDGDGSTTFILTTAAMLPVYLRLKMSPVVLTCVAGLANGTMNILPWGGPTARAATALKLDVNDVFVPMIPSLIAGLVVVFAFAWLLGLQERNRLRATAAGNLGRARIPLKSSTAAPPAARSAGTGRTGSRTPGTGSPAGMSPEGSGVAVLERTETLVDDHDSAMADTALDPNRSTLRPKLFWFNLGLTVAVMVMLVADLVPLPFVFMVGSAIALVVNFPKVKEQGAQLIAHAPSIVAVVSMVMAAAVLTGVLKGTGMVEAMSAWLVQIIPSDMGPLHGRDHRRAQHPDDVLHEQRRLLLRRPARAERNRSALRRQRRRNGPRLHHRPAVPPAEPAGSGHPAPGLAGQGGPGRPPQEGALAHGRHLPRNAWRGNADWSHRNRLVLSCLWLALVAGTTAPTCPSDARWGSSDGHRRFPTRLVRKTIRTCRGDPWLRSTVTTSRTSRGSLTSK